VVAALVATEVKAAVAPAIAEAVAAIPVPEHGKPGPGFVDAVVDGDGTLHLIATDGSRKSAGLVKGQSVDPLEVARLVQTEVDRLPKPPAGKDGFGIDDLNIRSVDGGRRLVLSFAREGVEPIEREVKTDMVIDRGLWRPGRKEAGDGVTWKGSFWIALRDTTTKPDDPGSDWRLAVKKGRDGKDAVRAYAGVS
jgi:hypothetical protein